MKVAYEGFTIDGQAVNGTVVADDRNAARKQLRDSGIFATRLVDAKDAPAAKGGRVPREVLAALLRQLSILISTGTPLVDALAAIERQAEDPRWATLVGELRRRIEEGAAFSDAMGAMPQVFDPICRTMAAAGESAGILDKMLADLADLYRRQARIRKAVIGALAYPCVVVAAAFIVLIALITVVLPKFKTMFDAVQAPVPAMTAALMAVGDGIREHWIISSATFLAGIGVLAWLARSSALRRRFIAATLTMPIVAPVVRAIATAHLVRCLGLLLESRIALLDALRLTSESMGHPAYVALLDRAQIGVSHGDPLSAALDDVRCIAPSVRQAIASAEKSGRLGQVLTQLGRHLDEDNETVVRGIARSVEPVLLAALGIVIGFVAISLFLPLFDIAASAGGGR
ncbi:MAG: type II secretion system F family protein [Phycisphaerae bacterium]|jgi:type II secretory pathway component PulF|nr:type II secretion system F family protein [Phycisphaerae bacterium]